MNRTLPDYHSLMNKVELPDKVRQHVREAALQTHQEDVSKNKASSSRIHRHPGVIHPLPRRLVAATCALALVGALAFASAILPLPSFNPSNPSGGNTFTLEAYASERAGTSSQSATLEFKNFGVGGGWSFGDYDEETNESHDPAIGGDGQIFAQIRFPLDMNCVGNNIRNITYSINADRIHFTRENRAHGPDDPKENNLEFKQENTFTLDYDGQTADRSKTARLLVAYYPLDERANELWQKLDYAHRDRSGQTNRTDEDEVITKELTQNIIHNFNKLIAEAPLTLTATFFDGSTQTKTYTIKPAEDFDQRWEEYHSVNSHWIFEPDPVFYTITEKTV